MLKKIFFNYATNIFFKKCAVAHINKVYALERRRTDAVDCYMFIENVFKIPRIDFPQVAKRLSDASVHTSRDF